MRRPYFKPVRASVTDDGYPVRGAVLITADPPGGVRLWSNLQDTRRSVRRVVRELREVRP